jgi:hypothetical protein
MIDVNCEEGDHWQDEKRSVVRIYITKNSTSEYCTGVLINNSDYDGTPYILTAEHCINKDNFAANSVFVFDYESPSCFGGDGDNSRSIAGAELLAVGDSLDFSLIRLSLEPPPAYDPYYAGWDRTGNYNNPTTSIHHPWGDVKKITLDYQAPSIPSKQSDVPYADLYDYYYFSYWWIKRWDVGSTQGGSSGSPLFNTDGQVIGLLSGGSARCGDSIGYDSDNNRVLYNNAFNVDDYYTQIKFAWDYKSDLDASLKPWLDPGNSGVTSLGGYEPAGIRPFNKDVNFRFSIFPNPATRLLHIGTDFILPGKTTFEILSLNGAILLKGQLEPSLLCEVDISSFDPGVYLIRISGNRLQETQKLLITP